MFPNCSGSAFPFNSLQDDDIFIESLYELNFGGSIDLNRIKDMVFNPFVLNENNNIPLFDTDPDINFYNEISNIGTKISEYLFEDQFQNSVKDISIQQFSIIHHNIRSLPAHRLELEAFLESLSFEFTCVGLTETWLCDATCNLHSVCGYNHVYNYRKARKGGGVSLLLKSDIMYYERTDLSYMNEYIESVFVEIDGSIVNATKNIVIGVIYRPPNTDINQFNQALQNLLENIKRSRKLCYLLGDYNIDLFKSESHAATSDFLNLMYSYSFLPVINRPTRITPFSATLIDNIFTNVLSDKWNSTSGIIVNDITDHYPIFVINKDFSVKEGDIYLVKRKMDENAKSVFLGLLRDVDWSSVFEESDTQLAYTSFSQIYSSIYNKSFPKYTVKYKYNNRKPWLSESMRSTIRHKNKLFKKYKISRTAKREKEYFDQKSKLKKILVTAEKLHYQEKFEGYKGNLRKTWSVIKHLINRGKKCQIQSKFIHNGRPVTDSLEITNVFNEFFVNVGPTLASKIPSSDISPTVFLKDKVLNTIQLKPVTEEELRKIVLALKDSACGYDKLDPKCVKLSCPYIINPLLYICNLSFSQGVFPQELKLAKVVPIFKAGDVMKVNNYRPVSVLSVMSKVLERLMYNRLFDFIEKFKILYDLQFGFRKDHATYMALMVVVDKIIKSLEKGEFTIGLFLDFSKAFDTIDHDVLFLKLNHYGIRGVALSWLKSYMTNRNQYVSYNGHQSATRVIRCGVPQGSILGPLLFLIYVNDLASVSDFLISALFADDTNMFASGQDIDYLQSKFNSELKNISLWLQVNKLSLNVDKSHFMVFTGGRQGNPVTLEINGIKLSQVMDVKFLGIIFDDKLNWKKHIDHISKKISRSIGILYKLRQYVNSDTMLSLYYTLVYPYLTYCNIIWGNACKTYLKPLFLIQKRIIRILSNVQFLEHTKPLFKNLNILKIDLI